jgi:RNA polymerase sigma-70 factor (ECF subfamily)
LSVSEEPEPPERALAAERARCAVVATVSALPARQRAVLLLRDVLSWRASDVADLLGTSVAGVNSALQRAHAALGAIDPERLPEPKNVHRRELVARYVAAFAEDDIDALVALSART